MAPLCYRRHRFPPGMSSGPCSALREPDPRSMPNRNRHVPRQPKPCRQHGGTGIGANRDIAVLWCDIAPPCASPPTAPPTERRTPARNPRFSTCSGLVCVRHGLSAGESWIRTSVPNDRLWALSWTPCNGPNARVIDLSAMASAMASSYNVAMEVGSAGAGRVRIETGSFSPAPPPSGMLRLSTSRIPISAREAPWFSLSSSAPRPTRTTAPNRAGARIEQAVVCRAVRRPLLVGGRVHRDPNCSYAG